VFRFTWDDRLDHVTRLRPEELADLPELPEALSLHEVRLASRRIAWSALVTATPTGDPRLDRVALSRGATTAVGSTLCGLLYVAAACSFAIVTNGSTGRWAPVFLPFGILWLLIGLKWLVIHLRFRNALRSGNFTGSASARLGRTRELTHKQSRVNAEVQVLGTQRLSGVLEVDRGAVRRSRRGFVIITGFAVITWSIALILVGWIASGSGDFLGLIFFVAIWIWPVGLACLLTVAARRQRSNLTALLRQWTDLHHN